jgi:hypothetical protein
MKSLATTLTLLCAAFVISHTAISQPVCDFTAISPTAQLQWYANGSGTPYSPWTPGSQNWEIDSSSTIGTPPTPVPRPFVLHTNPGGGNGSQSPQWLISEPMTGFSWQYNELQWTFWFGRRANNGQNGGNQDRSTVWLYVNRSTDLTNLTGLEGVRVTWHHNNNEDAIQLVEVHGGVEYVIDDTTFLANLNDYEWGTTIRVNRIPTGYPTGSQVRWTLYSSTPAPSFANFADYSVAADADPPSSAIYPRFDTTLSVIDSWIPTSTSGRMGVMSDYAVARKDAAEYNNLCFTELPPTPVELTSFTAMYRNDKVLLNWNTATELSNYGFDIERSPGLTGEWESVGFVEGSGNSNSPKDYSYVDIPHYDGVDIISYRLKQIDFDGQYEYSNTIQVHVAATSMDVLYNFPNPFNPSTNIGFNLVESDVVSLFVYSMSGERVAELYNNDNLNAGYYSVSFDASDLPSGRYYYELVTSSGSRINSMVLAK